MAASNQGDRDAYEKLLSELAGVIEAYVRARFGPLHALEDCVQECLMAVHNARHTYDATRPFRPWMFTVSRRRTIDFLRKQRREIEQDRGLEPSETEYSAENTWHDLIDGEKILQAIQPDHREALALTQYAGFTVPEVARKLGRSESAMKARLRRGLQAVRKQPEAEDSRR